MYIAQEIKDHLANTINGKYVPHFVHKSKYLLHGEFETDVIARCPDKIGRAHV